MLKPVKKLHILEREFVLSRRTSKHPASDLRKKDGFYLQISFICSLLVVTFAFLIFPRLEKDQTPYIPLNSVLIAYDIPETKQNTKTPPPPPRMPAIPVASDVEEILEEEELEFLTLDFYDFSDMPDLEPPSASASLGAKPKVLSWPKYDDSRVRGTIIIDIKVNAEGKIIDYKVKKNTTGSKDLEKVTVNAALKSEFWPAKDKMDNPIVSWTTRTFTFGTK